MCRRWYAALHCSTVVGLLGLVALVALPAGHAGAQPALAVVAQGLDNPRGLAFGPDGVLYVAEAGRGGAGPCVKGPEGGEVCSGASGAVARIVDGKPERIATGLPSHASKEGMNATGPHDIAFGPGRQAYLVTGLGAPPDARGAFGPESGNFAQLVHMEPSGQWRNVVDLGAYEQRANPDGDNVDTNPYALLRSGASTIVVDAGGNDLLAVAPNGVISTLATFPKRTVPAPPRIPNLPPHLPMQSVPNSVAMGPDGAYYVGELTGFPFPPGGARVYRVAPGQAPTIYAEGFTNIIDLAFGRDGSLYVLEIVSKGLLQLRGPSPDPGGTLYRIAPDHSRTIIAQAGLVMPTSVVAGSDGYLYLSNFGAMAGRGQIVRVVAPAPAGPQPNTGVDEQPLAFETGYTLDGTFLRYWQAHGGLPVFGMPIKAPRQVDGQISQWLERTRFELHPEHAAPYHVLLGRVGVEALVRQGRDWTTFAKASPDAAHYFAPTGHAITNADFWAFWRSHGLEFDRRPGPSFAESLALFGYPISDAKVETNSTGDQVLTQWFERARFEYHPAHPSRPGAPAAVLLGRLGAEAHPLPQR